MCGYSWRINSLEQWVSKSTELRKETVALLKRTGKESGKKQTVCRWERTVDDGRRIRWIDFRSIESRRNNFDAIVARHSVQTAHVGWNVSVDVEIDRPTSDRNGRRRDELKSALRIPSTIDRRFGRQVVKALPKNQSIQVQHTLWIYTRTWTGQLVLMLVVTMTTR